jgi:flagellar biogenesis protein FliO
MNENHDFNAIAKTVMDAAAAGVGLVSWMSVELFPVILQILSAIWLVLRLYEMDTIQRWLGKKLD